MRNSREIVRQKWLLGRAHRSIAESVGVSLGVVTKTLQRASAAGLTWEAVQRIEDEELERRLYPHAAAEAERKTLEEKLAVKLAEAEKSIASTRQAAMGNVRGIAADAAAAIVQQLTGVLPDGKSVDSAVDASLKGET